MQTPRHGSPAGASRDSQCLHRGVYVIPGRREWAQWNEQIPVAEYAKLADQFKPEHFDPDVCGITG